MTSPASSSASSFTVRQATTSLCDRNFIISSLLAMLIEGQSRNAELPFDPTIANAERFYEAFLRHAIANNDPILIAEIQCEPVGLTMWTCAAPVLSYKIKIAQGHGTYVVPAHRNRGIGRGLHQVGEQALRDRGFQAISGMIDVTNVASHSLAASEGYKVHSHVVMKML